MVNTPKILIIDDEEDFCSLITLLFKRDQYQVDCVHNLADAEIKLSLYEPEIILLDHNLPDGRGLEFFTAHKELFQKSHIILITADPSPQLKVKAFEAGVHFLSKPVQVKKIRDLVKMVA